MPSKKKFNKKDADTFKIVHRTQQDPRTHDGEETSTRVLHPVNTSSPLTQLPPEVLPSEGTELPRDEKIQFAFGLIEVDPEILEALEGSGDEDFEELPDNFVKLANMENLPDDLENEFIEEEEFDSEEEFDEEGDLNNQEKEIKERGKYDKRDLTEQRSILEERFEKMLELYDEDDEEEDQDNEEQGFYSNAMDPNMQSVLDEFLESTNKHNKHKDGISEDTRKMLESSTQRKKELSEQFEYLQIKQEPEFDCESITTTYSNLYNHPKVIEEPSKKSSSSPSGDKIKLSSKTGIPIGVLPERETKPKQFKLENKGKPRLTEETLEEKKQRKKQIKEERKQQRENKKNLKMVFKTEHLHQIHLQAASNQVSAIKL